MTMQHECRCKECDPSLIGPAEPLSGTLSVDWGTLGTHVAGYPYVNCVAYPNVYALQLGDHGYVLHYRGKDPHICQSCNKGACAERVEGKVVMRYGDRDIRRRDQGPDWWNWH